MFELLVILFIIWRPSFLNHHLRKYNILFSLNKSNSKRPYLIQLTRDFCKPTSQIYFEKHFNDCILGWKYVYVLPCIVTSDPHIRYFQYKFLNDVLYLNEKFFCFGIFSILLNALVVTKIAKQLSISFVTAFLQKT